MSVLKKTYLCCWVVLYSVALWSQSEDPTKAAPGQNGPTPVDSAAPDSNAVVEHPEDRMQTPPPVAVQSFPLGVTSEERGSFLKYGLSFTTAYTDNALYGFAANPVSDVSYSVAPTIALDERTSRMRVVASYAPGFTFYQRLSERNEADHNAAIQFSYRLSPHVTFAAEDDFQKSSNVFNNPNFGYAGGISGSTVVPNFSVISPIADRLTNSGSVGLTYQFSLNGMVGASGSFSILEYPNPSQVPGLFNSNSQAGSAFYAFRFTNVHYVGITYQYQRLVAQPAQGQSETQTHAALLFYTLTPGPHFSLSFFGGPQYSDTSLPAFPPVEPSAVETRSWDPAAGASISWQGHFTNVAVSYSRSVASGGGLLGAVHMQSASAAIRQQLGKRLSASLEGGYAQNSIITGALLSGVSGHTISGTASLQREIGQHLSARLGYTRLHQHYDGVSILSASPDTNREFVSISYQFTRPLGR